MWVDAQTGAILKLETLIQDVGASGITYNRDPGVGTIPTFFDVDAASGGQYTLRLAGVMNRVDYLGNGFDAQDVSIANNTNGSTATFANFNQTPINDAAQALCSSGTNKGFQQVRISTVRFTATTRPR